MYTVNKSDKLQGVCYDIRGPVQREATRLEEEGHRILRLNIGNPTPFGFVTSEGTPEMRDLAKEAGALFLITKPFTSDDFEATLAPVLNKAA